MPAPGGNRIRVATIPDDHPYLQAVLPDYVERVRFPGAGEWAPSPLLDVAGLAAALSGVDVVHVHFGYESLTPQQLQVWLTALAGSRTALVVTVHDLRNPHHLDPGWHDAQLGLLMAAADDVITLTPGAAQEIGRRWGRVAVVHPHPTLVPAAPVAARTGRPGAAASGPVAGLHLKSVRANVVEPVRVARAAAVGAQLAGGTLRVDVHPGAESVLAPLAELAAGGLIDLRVHERFTDDELFSYLGEISVSVLPYRFGSHSGWLELCRDVGVAVVAPDCGYYAEQWTQVHTFTNNEHTGMDDASLTRAVAAALSEPRPAPAQRAARLAQRDEVRAGLGRIYTRLAGQVQAAPLLAQVVAQAQARARS